MIAQSRQQESGCTWNLLRHLASKESDHQLIHPSIFMLDPDSKRIWFGLADSPAMLGDTDPSY